MRALKILILPVLILASCAAAQTLRPNHWLMDDVDYHWNRGRMWNVSSLSGPLTIQQLSDSLQRLDQPGMLSKFAAPAHQSGSPFIWLQLDNALRAKDGAQDFHSVQRAGAGMWLHPQVQIFGSFNIDNQLDADSSYLGERQSGYAAFMEQAYIRGQWHRFAVSFGRDYLSWGPGVDASLHLSDVARPMDHLSLSWNSKYISLFYFTAGLDQTEFNVDEAPHRQHRYVSGHRIEVRPAYYLRLGLSETALFGPDKGVDFALVNPLLFYTGVEQNGPQSANVMASLDATLLLRRTVSLYFSFLIDDFQFESKSVDDRGEPAAYGVLSGFNWADPFGANGVDIFSEYTRVTNRTYNGQGGPWEKYLHRNRPIGHFLGNDVDRAIIGMRYRKSAKLWLRARYEFRRRGEGRIEN